MDGRIVDSQCTGIGESRLLREPVNHIAGGKSGKERMMDIREKTKKFHGYSDSAATGEEYVMEWANCREASIAESGDIWIADPQVGHWLSDDELATFIDWCENSFGWTFGE